MKTSNHRVSEMPQTNLNPVEKSSDNSFLSFQKIILANSKMRKQVRDVVDLALFDYALQQNVAFIKTMREKAESETIQLMMRFVNGVSDYRALSKIIHRNWVIKTLARLDSKDQAELIDKITHPVGV